MAYAALRVLGARKMEARVMALEDSVKQIREDLRIKSENIDQIKKDHEDLEAAMEKAKGVMDEVQSRNVDIRSTLATAMTNIQKEKDDFMDAVGLKLAQGENQIGVIIQEATKRFDQIEGGARTKFEQLENDLREIYQRTANSVKEIEARVAGLEQGGGGGDREGGKSYLPQKSILPKVFEDKLEEWRRWTGDVADYIDTQCKGVKELLVEIDGTEEDIDEQWRESKQGLYPPAVLDQVKLYRALKKLTCGESQKVVNSVGEEDGFRAWQKLRLRFEPGLQAKRGIILMELNNMQGSPAKSPAELVILITELEQKIKTVRDITGEEVGEMHAHSVLIGILDPLTRSNTAMSHGLKYEQLKKLIIQFANNATATGAVNNKQSVTNSNDMNIGSLDIGAGSGEVSGDDADGGFNALGKGGGARTCYTCGGIGHFSRDCPSDKGALKGKGKPKGWGEPWAKGKGKDSYGPSKGKGKAPRFGGCYVCGGAHFAADCPEKGKGKGKSGKGLRSLEEDSGAYDWWSSGVLSCIQEYRVPGQQEMNAENEKNEVQQEVNYETCGICGPCQHQLHQPVPRHVTDEINKKKEKSKLVSVKIRDETMKQGTRMEASNLLDEPLPSTMTHHPSSCRVTNFTGDTDAEKKKIENIFVEEGWTVKMSKRTKKKLNSVSQRKLNMLSTIEPGGMNAINVPGGWEEFEFAVDSGATETVLNEDMLMSVETKPGAASRRGVEYEVANGSTIPNLGEKKFRGFSSEGQGKDITAQVCDVNKALLSVRKIVAAGNKVIFEKQGAYIEDPGGRQIWLEEKQGMYMLKLWVKKADPF